MKCPKTHSSRLSCNTIRLRVKVLSLLVDLFLLSKFNGELISSIAIYSIQKYLLICFLSTITYLVFWLNVVVNIYLMWNSYRNHMILENFNIIVTTRFVWKIFYFAMHTVHKEINIYKMQDKFKPTVQCDLTIILIIVLFSYHC